jgi:DNA primase
MAWLPRISREQIDAIKSRVDLAALLAERGIALQRKGRHLFALCPFHSEKTPSFVVTPQRGLFHCFGCGVAGDAIGFLVRYDRVSFPEAVRTLAARAGVEIDSCR